MPTIPYDTLETVVDLARMRLNDMIVSVNGDIFTDNAVFTPSVITGAWRRTQSKLASLGYSKFTEEVAPLIGIPAVPLGALDPGVFAWLDWTGYWNGVGPLNTSFVLPQDMILPTRCDERINSGTNPPTQFLEMDDFTGHTLPMTYKEQWNKYWEWRDEKIWLRGSLTTTDLRIRYKSYLADFVPSTTTAFNLQLVPIMRVADCFSWYIVANVSGPRGDLDTKSAMMAGDAAAAELVSLENPSVLQSSAPAEAA